MLVDFEGDCNVMPYGIYERLGCPPLVPTTVSFVSFFAGSRTVSVGRLSVSIRIGSDQLPIDFHIAPPELSDADLILGRKWIARHNLQLDWQDRTYSMKVSDSVLTRKSADVKEEVFPDMDEQEASSTWIVDEDRPTHGWLVKNACLKEQAYGRGETFHHAIWLPKYSYTSMSQKPR